MSAVVYLGGGPRKHWLGEVRLEKWGKEGNAECVNEQVTTVGNGAHSLEGLWKSWKSRPQSCLR